MITEYIFEDVYHKEMWNNIVEEINKIEFGKEMKFKYFIDLKLYCYYKLNYEGEVPCGFCFACEYGKQFEYEDDKCENCPFKGVDPDKMCLNYTYGRLKEIYNRLYVVQKEQVFNYHKQECIENATKIRDWKIKEGVLCRNNIK